MCQDMALAVDQAAGEHVQLNRERERERRLLGML